MCLAYELSKKSDKEIKALANRRGWIKVYKVCYYRETGIYRGRSWAHGLHESIGHQSYFDAGWYGCLSLAAARKEVKILHHVRHTHIKTCYAKPEWIKRLGSNDCEDGDRIGIFTHLVFPKWQKGKMTIREFKALCKAGKE